MFLKVHRRRKDGKEHRYYSLVESVRTARGPQHRTLAYLGELNACVESGWRRAISVLNQEGVECQLQLFASDATDLPCADGAVQVRLDQVGWQRPRDFGEVFLVQHLWRLLGLNTLLSHLLPAGEEEVGWDVMAFILCAARLLSPSSELAIEERFYPSTALDELAGVAAEKVNKDRLYRALDHLLPHKSAIESHLKSRLGTLFNEPFDLLLYDLTSSYFEGSAAANPLAVRGYSRDGRPQCVQIVIGLVVTRSGLPLGYEVFAGNRSDATTLQQIMERIESLHGKASRIWVFDRGIASEKNLERLRQSGGLYLVGTPRTLLRKMEEQLLDRDWKQVREGIEVKLAPAPEGSPDTFILCRSAQRREKESAIHTRFEKRFEEGLQKLKAAVASGRVRSRDQAFQRLGRLQQDCSRVARAYRIEITGDGDSLAMNWSKDEKGLTFQHLCQGAYLLRTNLTGMPEEELWKMYMQLSDAEAAFRTLKQDLSIRPIYHQLENRTKAHVLVCFIAYAMYRTLDRLAQERLGCTARKVLAQLSGIKSGDILLPLVDGRQLCLRRVSRPDPRQAEILTRLHLSLPERLGLDTLHPACSTDLRPSSAMPAQEMNNLAPL
jgi:transposase